MYVVPNKSVGEGEKERWGCEHKMMASKAGREG